MSGSDAKPSYAAKILNVNDNEGARYMVSSMLTRAGFSVTEARSGFEALDAAVTVRPDLVILDIRLPDIDGLEVCQRLRANVDTSSIKVLHTSATFVGLDSKVQSLEGGADAYLAQPFESEELIATVRSLLRLNAAERQLRDNAAELREADRRKNEFLAMLAHELRNPLAAITSSIPVLSRQEPLDGMERRAREVLKRQTAHLGRLIDDLLDVARVTQGKIELNWDTVDLSGLLTRVVTASEQTKTGPRNQHLHLALPDRPVLMRGDATRLDQIFTNLLDNASKYTDPGGSIYVELNWTANETGAIARVVVRDTGMGMTPETLPNIFLLFSQADVPVARSRGGLGIGLTLVRTLVQLHGGQIKARSAGPGEGSEFEIELPALRERGRRSVPPSGDGLDVGDGARRRVLIVEDNSDAQQALADLIHVWGHEVLTASDGLSGVRAALELSPDIALVDIGLPGIDGYEVARRLRASALGEGLLLVALTGYGAPEQRARALECGFDLHLVKPVDPVRLETLIREGTLTHSEPPPGVPRG